MGSLGLTSRQRLLYVVIIMVGICYGVYALYSSSVLNSIDLLESEIITGKAELIRLQEATDNKVLYQRLTESNNQELNETVDLYLPSITEKDLIAYADAIENGYGLKCSLISFDKLNTVDSVSYTFDRSRGATDLLDRHATFEYTAAYNDLKAYLKDIRESDLKLSLMEINLAYDSNVGCLTGLVEVRARAITSSNKVDETYNSGSVMTGVKDIFGEYEH